jgi:putative ABC transport system permease protein
MVVWNSIRQLLRTPVKTFFFFLLLICTVTFFMLGYNLWSIAARNMAEIERSFTTIGTVEQKAKSLEKGASWDAGTKSYTYHTFPRYAGQIPISVLDFKGANYIQKPEKRPYYVAYHTGYVLGSNPNSEVANDIYHLIVEMQPLEDCETGDPVRMRITKLLRGNLGYIKEIWFCNHYDEKPYKLYADKTYIAAIQFSPLHAGFEGTGGFGENEYIPAGDIRSTQSTKDGKRINDTMPEDLPWDEVTPNFYETPRGKRWVELMKSLDRGKHTIPVVPTNGTKLLMAFYDGGARIVEGRDISPAEYQNGEKVCLIQKDFAENNKLTIGDTLPLPLYYADYRLPSSTAFTPGIGGGFPFISLNAKGESYPAFEDSTYKVVGIYSTRPVSAVSGYEMGNNAVVIPSLSVKNSDANNIIWAGPMMGYSTSFQIPNGQIAQYTVAWEALGIRDLDIRFYDKGYTKIKAGLDDMISMAILLFTIGAVTTLFVIALFCHLFIAKQRKRTAIERSLGMGKARCTVSLLTGMMIIVVAAYIAGIAASTALTGYAVKEVNAAQKNEAFDTTFSDWVNSADTDMPAGITSPAEGAADVALMGTAVIPAALVIALLFIRGNLKAEPLRLLGEKEK